MYSAVISTGNLDHSLLHCEPANYHTDVKYKHVSRFWHVIIIKTDK